MHFFANRRRVWRLLVLICMLCTFSYFFLHKAKSHSKATSKPANGKQQHYQQQQQPLLRPAPLKYLEGPYVNPPFNLTWTRPTELANGCLLFVTRTKSLTKVRRTMFDIEKRFNDRYDYPYVFLSEEPFSDEFKKSVWHMAGAKQGKVKFGLIDKKKHWEYPEWINPQRAENAQADWAAANEVEKDKAGSRHMARYLSGPFALHPALKDYKYVWRLEPGSHYTCDFEYDPFVYMQSRNLAYGFGISFEEFPDAVPSILKSLMEFIQDNINLIDPSGNSLGWIINKGIFNRCQFLANFEIMDLEFIQSPSYQKLFSYLDKLGGIYYERWSDSTVRSLAISLFLNASRVHWFDDVGYKHDFLNNCPQSLERQARCHCDPAKSSHLIPMSCSNRWNSSTSIDPQSLFQ